MANNFFIKKDRNSKPPFAIIHVTYPANSTVTCTDNVKTFTIEGTSGSDFFQLPNGGTWTVSCTNGTETADPQIVEITEINQIAEVALTYWDKYLFRGGTTDAQRVQWSGGWTSIYKGANDFTIYANNNKIVASTYGSGATANGYIQTANMVDLSKFSTLHVYKTSSRRGQNGYLGLYPSLSVVNSSGSSMASVSCGDGTGTLTLGIGSITSGRIRFSISASTQGGGAVEATQVWLS